MFTPDAMAIKNQLPKHADFTHTIYELQKDPPTRKVFGILLHNDKENTSHSWSVKVWVPKDILPPDETMLVFMDLGEGLRERTQCEIVRLFSEWLVRQYRK